MSRRAPPDRRLALPIVVAAVAFVSAAAAAPSVPKGKRSLRKPATHVVVRPTLLDALGVSVRLSPGVAVVAPGARPDGPVGGKVAVTLDDPVAISGRVDGSALGARLARPTPLADPSGGAGAILGEGREGALVVVLGRAAAPGMVLCETVGAVRARIVVPSDALTAEPRELVFPVVEDTAAKMQAVTSQAELLGAAGGRPRAHLAPGARVLVFGPNGDGADDRSGDGGGRPGWARVRTYGAFALDGVLPRERIGPVGDPAESEAPSSKGLTPTHEVLTEAAASADALGKKPIGTLRGGALVTVGIEVSGPRARVMTHGDAVGEVWVPSAALRSLERDVWSEHE